MLEWVIKPVVGSEIPRSLKRLLEKFCNDEDEIVKYQLLYSLFFKHFYVIR